MNEINQKPILSRDYSYQKDVNVIHLGLGAFFRAFTCDYFQRMNEFDANSIRVMGVCLRTPDKIRALERQDGLFTAFEKGAHQLSSQVFDCIYDLVFAPDNPHYLLEALARPRVNLVTLTVTEKAYCLIPSSRELDLNNPDIIYDLKHPTTPRSAIGFLVYGLNLRRQRGIPPFTCLSCDNLPSNGKALSNAVLGFANRLDPKLGEWILNFGAFPSSMVDRIVPSISNEEVNYISTLTSYRDMAPVVHESYSLWVIENQFTSEAKFDFKKAGVKVVSDVGLFEHLKLRCLNGTHSALAYLGFLSGFKTVFEAVSNPILESFLDYLWKNEIVPTVIAPPDFEISDYVQELLDRYKNPNIKHLVSFNY